MNWKYCKSEGERWEWEKTREIYLYGLHNVSDDEIARAIELVNSVISEFDLPLSVKNGNKHKEEDLNYIEKLLQRCSDGKGKADFDLLEEELYRLREEEGILPYGIIILVHEDEYEFKDQKAIYGSGSPEGLIVIRRKYINSATKHEFGHMIGLGEHHENCVMMYTCDYEQFCGKCKKEIKEVWEL